MPLSAPPSQTTPPTPPQRSDPANFAVRGDGFLAWIVTWFNELLLLIPWIRDAAAICESAAQAVNVSAWISGAAYSVGTNVYDTTNFLTYRRKVAGIGTTRPGLDSTNWQLLTGFGDVDTVSDQSIGGVKSFGANMFVGTTAVYTNGTVELGAGGSGDRASAVDFHSYGGPYQDDFSARIIRSPGANGDLLIQNAGSGRVRFFENGVEQGLNNAGEVSMFARNTAPTGWLKANGAAISRTTYAALFSVIGINFGAGNGTTTFNLPDLRGEFIRAWDDGRGVDSGRVIFTSQAGEIQSHAHAATSGQFSISGAGQFSYGGGGSSLGLSTNTAAAGGTETRPRNIALLACIKF